MSLPLRRDIQKETPFQMQNYSTTPKSKLSGTAFAARRAQIAVIKEAIVTNGTPELHEDSTALCSHFKLRRGVVGGETAEAQVYTHSAGIVIRFWVYGLDFSVKCRDLVLLDAGDKGPETWLEADGKLFPHEGKYVLPAIQIASNIKQGR